MRVSTNFRKAFSSIYLESILQFSLVLEPTNVSPTGNFYKDIELPL